MKEKRKKFIISIVLKIARSLLDKYDPQEKSVEVIKKEDVLPNRDILYKQVRTITLSNTLCAIEDAEIPEEHIENGRRLRDALEGLEILTKEIYPNFAVDWSNVNRLPNTSQAYRYPKDKKGASKSSHKEGMARDIPDKAITGLPKGNTWAEIIEKEELLLKLYNGAKVESGGITYGGVLLSDDTILEEGTILCMENKKKTGSWTHLQIRPTGSLKAAMERGNLKNSDFIFLP